MIIKAFQTILSLRLFEFFLISFLLCFGASAAIENEHRYLQISERQLWGSDGLDSLRAFVNKDIMVLGRYSGTKRKFVKKGTLIKVYLIKTEGDSINTGNLEGLRPISLTYRGTFESIIGDQLTMLHFDKEMKFDIDDLYQIKVYNEIGARVFGDLFNLTGFAGIGIGGLAVAVAGTLAVDRDPWSTPVFAIGAVFGGLGYLVHRIALLIRRSKYDLISDWYIVRNI